MIRIDPFQFEEEYFGQIQKDHSPVDKLTKILGCPSTDSFVNYLRKNFRTIILNKPHELGKIINHCETSGWNQQLKSDSALYKSVTEAFGYENYFRDRVKKGLWLADRFSKVGIKSCPYCNAQYTISATSKGRFAKKYQFDHYYPQSDYPYLSISLYNLIPSCAGCNQSKSDKKESELYYHPYKNSIAAISEFYSEYEPNPNKLTIKEAKNLDMEIVFRAKFSDFEEKVKGHDEIFSIEGIYKNHNDIAQELLTKAVIYNSAQGKSIRAIEGLFEDKATYLRYLLGNYPYEEDILKRPLAKFTQDIAKQLGLL